MKQQHILFTSVMISLCLIHRDVWLFAHKPANFEKFFLNELATVHSVEELSIKITM